MKFPRALRRFIVGYLALHLFAAGILVVVLTGMARQQMLTAAQDRMRAMTSMLVETINELDGGLENPDLPGYVKSIGDETKMRFTLIQNNGLVVADSITGVRDIGPHGSREEVVMAKLNGTGFSERYSSTLDQPMMYLAQKFTDPAEGKVVGFVRIATPSESINSSIASIQRYVWVFAICLSVVTALLMTLFSAKSMEPLAMFSSAARKIGIGDYQISPSVVRRNDEWGELSEAFQHMQTELTRREETLIENGQRLEAVLSSMIEGVIALEPDGKVMIANGAACEMLSLTRPEIVSKKLLEIVRIPELRTAIENTQKNRTYSETEFKTLTKPQKTLSTRVSILADNNKPGVAVVLHDVTALRQLETIRQDFVANVSHELKTPLASIKAYAETLRLGALHDNEKNEQFVHQIETQADLLNRQIHDLLDLARVESGETNFTLNDVNLNVTCQSCFDQFRVIAEDRNLIFETDFTNPGPIVRADADAMETIVKNLIVNAIHYTQKGGRIRISTRTQNDESIFEVSDTGIGIAIDQQARVFERFYRVDKARSRDMGGTGLGLAIVKHLSQSFGGSVNLQSSLGNGSTFQVRFPTTVSRLKSNS
ncbi:MAG: ATP-binding protein [Mariniblastus sp.]|nr:ATP-binding protein [Mariniblastus sp.]